jgi:hypothetical protein
MTSAHTGRFIRKRKGLGEFFPLVVDSHTWAHFDELVCLPLMGINNLENILSISPMADL